MSGHKTLISTRAARGEATNFYSRFLIYLTATTTLAAAYSAKVVPDYLVWALPYLLLYPLLFKHHRLDRFRDSPTAASLDGLHIGSLIAAWGFMPAPSLVLLLLIVLNSQCYSGARNLPYLFLFLIASSASLFFLLQPEFVPAAPPVCLFAVAITTSLYLAVTGKEIHARKHKLQARDRQLREEKERHIRLMSKLSRYLSPPVWESLFSGDQDGSLETQRKRLTVFFSDIKGFTELSEEMESEELTELLNNYLTEMSNIALKYGGTIDKFVGDAIMVFFGDSKSGGAKRDALAAVSMAIAMRKHMKVLRQRWLSQGIQRPLQIRMGINTGFCTVGNFGAASRMDYTIIGKEVNLASRLESNAEPGQILISYETYSMIKDVIMCRDKGALEVKGFSRPVPTFQVVDFRKDLGADQSFIEHQIDGFSMYLDTEKVKSYDKERVVQALQSAARQLKERVIL
ncbi:adenylate/guanylate cyclase domain-containing protein [Aestuariirhabdus litorea]|uniref:Adenylate/guanylate cyclase domain-containing protein n=1 Tax=Aestuariirhabdus litorea TaxID=2528527 RepID=A0A3P3VPN8_9GAMM|nr:adenylate/guanylate cyclase domain-containing protein [Aestuariirhabdus litorea]RRJ84570.1 adenylate/guanylate cyclase domain-containing protein [Aestuariirhabdus litorea]RWW97796.1 adenylate/guanylate cyclase domain-containing protein [Endozoicomonadaceae bacterium GTF-13]